MINIFKQAEKVLSSASITEKLELTADAFSALQAGELSFEDTQHVEPISFVCFPDKPVWIPPTQLPRRRLGTDKGKSSFVHAIAHIEFNAIHLAWDIAYRFRGFPEQFYKDWLTVANDECRHFMMLNERLKDFSCTYGDLPSHDGLWSMAVKTKHDILARLSLVPRYLEARGLDVTPAMLGKLQAVNDIETMEILKVILAEEVSHVGFGTTWLHFVCEQQKLHPQEIFFENVNHYLKRQIRGPFNRELRLQAGFTEEELDQLEKLDVR